MELKTVREQVAGVLAQTPVVDVHTHLYGEAFGKLLLWGIDELLTYHYLVAELFRYRPDLPYETFWAMPKAAQADLIWNEVFLENTPLSEAARGVVTTLHELGLDPGARNLDAAREFFARQTTPMFIERVLELTNVKCVVMTNDPFDPVEQSVWQSGAHRDTRFKSALRLDRVLNDYDNAVGPLRSQGFAAETVLTSKSIESVRDFLRTWIDRMHPVYMAVSLPPDFRVDDNSTRAHLITQCVLPVAEERSLPLALMIGVKKGVNPALGDAGDSVGKADISVVEQLARDWPRVRFLVTMLSRENQHELCVAARKFGNLIPFGCWWFLNNPSIVREITTERFELLGLSMIPQHSDARVLDQLIYKWHHAREIIADVLAARYVDLMHAGWIVTPDDMRRDVKRIMQAQGLVE